MVKMLGTERDFMIFYDMISHTDQLTSVSDIRTGGRQSAITMSRSWPRYNYRMNYIDGEDYKCGCVAAASAAGGTASVSSVSGYIAAAVFSCTLVTRVTRAIHSQPCRDRLIKSSTFPLTETLLYDQTRTVLSIKLCGVRVAFSDTIQ